MTVQIDPKQSTNNPVTQDEMQATLERVLMSKRFVNAPMKQRFLRLICEFHIAGRGGELNEYLIGREVFDRNDSYSPATDPIVRVSAHGVREKLNLYNQKEGADDEIQIEIPIGSYEPVFCRKNPAKSVSLNDEPVAALVSEAAANPLPSQRGEFPATAISINENNESMQKRDWLMLAIIALLACASAYLWWQNYNLQAGSELALSKINKFRASAGIAWKPFLEGSQPTLIIMSNPVVHRLANAADPETLIKKGITLSTEQFNVLNSAAGNRLPLATNEGPRLVPAFNMYTGIGEAIGAYRLTGLFHEASEIAVLKQSRSISPEDLKSHDVIMLGSVYSNQWSKPLSIKENFVYTNRSTIENLAPQTGEEREYKAVFNQSTGALLEDYALVTVTPGVSGDKTVMVLAGIFSEGTEAAAEYVTDLNHLQELNRQLRKLKPSANGNLYYQALLKVHVENAFPTKISLLTVRELSANGQ